MEIKINAIYVRNDNEKVCARVIDRCTFESGVEGVVIVPAGAEDSQVEHHEVAHESISVAEFCRLFHQAELEQGDEVIAFSMGKNVGIGIAEETEDPRVMKITGFDGLLVLKKVQTHGILVPVFQPASQQARDYTVSALEERVIECQSIIDAMVKDAQNYVDSLRTYPATLVFSLNKLRAAANAQKDLLNNCMKIVRDTIQR